MERREFLKSLGAVPSIGLLAAAAHATAGESGKQATVGAASAPAGAVGPDSAAALAELQQAMQELDAGFADPAWRLRGAIDYAEARGVMLHTLHHAIECWFEADPERPVFKRFVTPEKKLLGDNPDAVYFTAAVRPDRVYRIRGNLAQATYTSLTVELGTAGGGPSTGVGGTRNDRQFEAAADGSYEIQVGGDDPGGNWLPLAEGAGSVTTRHYYEREVCVAGDRLHHIPIVIEPVEPPGPRPAPTDASIAAGLRRTTRFLRGTVFPPSGPEQMPDWFSAVPNRFPPPVANANQEIGFAAVDNTYLAAPFVVRPDQMLVLRGRFPECRFANVVLWNRFMQSFDYLDRTISLNRKQVQYEDDGSFRIVLAHRDPGLPNWLDLGGRPVGTIFWRFQLATSPIEAIEAQLRPLPA